jgi:hypothetical protein
VEYAKEFERDFMRRTLELVRGYRGPYDATNLLNCLLGLLIVPKETSINKIPAEPVAQLGRWGISPQSIQSFGRDHPQTLRQVVWSLRNAVAHFRFKPMHNNGQCVGFEFNDQSGFRAVNDKDEMRVFVERLADHLEREASA